MIHNEHTSVTAPVHQLINVLITLTLAPGGLILAFLGGRLNAMTVAAYGALEGDEKAAQVANERVTYWDMATPMLAWFILVAAASWWTGSVLQGVGVVVLVGLVLILLDLVIP